MNNAFESIQQVVMEAIEFTEGNSKAAIVHQLDTADVKEVRHDVIDASYSTNKPPAPYPE